MDISVRQVYSATRTNAYAGTGELVASAMQTPASAKGSLTCASGMLYARSINRLMGLVRPTPTEFKVVSSFEIPEGGRRKSWAHPVVCNGRLYLRHGEFQ